ncbi:MAG: xanthorhodopsin [Bacteroidetes bacterium QS_9_68_14]|nr:MAG: xanthorhodopsin [Bacteroidetes bacterium QS_9_68_14]
MELSFLQYNIVYNLFSLTIAVMFASGVYFLATSGRIAERYRPAMYVSALIVFVAGYHYLRIFQSWDAAFELSGAAGEMSRSANYTAAADHVFNEAYRYADWMLTVPLLIVELYIVTKARDASKSARSSMTALILATIGMLATGYIGETYTADTGGLTMRFVWGTISSVFFAYIVFRLYSDVSSAQDYLPGKASLLAGNTKLLLLFTWGFYPIVYCFPFLGLTGATSFVAVQSGYTIADIAAKAGYGLLIHHIARERTIHEGGVVSDAAAAAEGRSRSTGTATADGGTSPAT